VPIKSFAATVYWPAYSYNKVS